MQNALQFLKDTQDLAGGWGYISGGTPGVEPTALAALALQGFPQAAPCLQQAREWLLSIQNADGGWGLNELDTRSGWHSAWGALALAGWPDARASFQRGLAWLAATPVYRVEDLDLIQSSNRDLKIDVALAAWPWGPGEASWVLPSALAMLALRERPLTPEAQTRLQESLRYLENRRVPGGGWNAGNPAMFEGVLPAHTIPTAVSLLALAAHAPALIQPGDLAVLQKKAFEDGGARALGWALLTLRTLGEETAHLRRQLMSLQQADGSWEGSPYPTAVALLGLEGSL